MHTRASVGVLLALLVGAGTAHAQTFRWVDDEGNPHYVGSLDQVPEQYRFQFEPRADPKKDAPVPVRGTSETAQGPTVGECVLKIARTRTQPGSLRSYPNCEACRRGLEAMRGPDRGLADCVSLEASR
jgi:Domain of unknown function (DUF4124)